MSLSLTLLSVFIGIAINQRQGAITEGIKTDKVVLNTTLITNNYQPT
jgi:hypothetical protein